MTCMKIWDVSTQKGVSLVDRLIIKITWRSVMCMGLSVGESAPK